MKVLVLGTGCTKCRKLYELAAEAIKESGVTADLSKVEKIEDIVKFNVMITPALVINGVLKSSGRLPAKAEIVNWITTEISKQ